MANKKCESCQQILPKDGNYVTCDGCKYGYHYGGNCAGVSKDTWKGKSERLKSEWRCKSCRTAKDGTSTKRNKSTDESEDSESENEMTDIDIQLKNDVEELKKSVALLLQENEEFKQENSKLKKEVTELKKDYHDIKNMCADMKAKLEKNTTTVQKTEQYSRNVNIELFGIEQKNDENLVEIVTKLATHLKITDFKIQDIEKMHRIPKTKSTANQKERPGKNIKPNSIIVQFKSRALRDKWIPEKKLKTTNKNIFNDGSEDTVYINEHLTQHYKHLLWLTKKTAKERKWKYTWWKNGKLLCRKQDGDKVITIETEQDLTKLT